MALTAGVYLDRNSDGSSGRIIVSRCTTTTELPAPGMSLHSPEARQPLPHSLVSLRTLALTCTEIKSRAVAMGVTCASGPSDPVGIPLQPTNHRDRRILPADLIQVRP